MTGLPDLFPGFAERRVKTAGGLMFLRTGGSGPPLLLLHGYPQSHACWHKIAPELAQHFTLVVPDLRGYGSSTAPAGDAEHKTYSKRAMAEDCLAIMHALGHARFIVAGHDRGGRVAYRLALDHPDAVRALVPVDILPTAEVWRRMGADSAVKSYHWSFLAQPHPMPETLIGRDPVFYLEHTLKSWAKPRNLSPFLPEALVHYRALLKAPERVHAVCEDYRAGATIDRQLDEADLAGGRQITCPTFLLWGSDYIGKGSAEPRDVWRPWCRTPAEGEQIDSGHFLAEENPRAMLAALLPFLNAHRDAA
ncbi:MAG: alpha/beta hydrolase [Hyphomicrobiaceae bacterium]|nr:MAG: alpha/beta hydrolase [Hyphomicrobiaceae bacterium]